MKKTISLLLCLVLLTGLAVTVRANTDIELGQNCDDSIFAGGIYDLFAWVGGETDDYYYQWQVDVSMGDGSWVDLEDNANPNGYAGTKTYHMQFFSPRGNGQIIDSGWDDIPFRCRVTHKKTGVSAYTADMYMKIFSSDDLEEYMAKKGIELYTPTVNSRTASTTDDVTYYASAPAGTNLKLACGFKPPQNDPLMGRSDMTGEVEVWITENGKTVKKADGVTYTPSVIGKDAVTVQFKLHYKLGINDLGYYQTKTLKLSTSEPAVVGRGTAKQQMSLLKEPYSQSQTLTTIPKGQEVLVHTNSGSWYQVSYNGYVGYVAGSSLNYENYTPVIEHVNVAIAEPLAGNLPATSNTVTPDSCFATSVEWLDKTTDRYMEPGERFVKGHTYQLVVWASAKEGYRFKLDANDNMLTTATINDTHPAYTSRAYEQIIGKVIDIRFDFVNIKGPEDIHQCNPKPVSRVAPTCTKAGFEAYYKCSCGKTYRDARGTQEVDLHAWGTIPATGHKEGTWSYNSTHHYKKCTVCAVMIPSTNTAHTGGTATCTEKAKCSVCSALYGQVSDDHKWSPKYHPVDEKGHAYQCADCKTYDTVKPHNPGPEATDTTPQTCRDCGYIITPAKNHTHKYQKVEAVSATCVIPGSKEYYTCDGCEQWWWDIEGKEPISDKSSVKLEALGHFTGEQWSFDDETHWLDCVVCMQPVEEGREPHRDEDSDGRCDVCLQGENAAEGTEPTEPPETLPSPSGEKSSGSNGWFVLVLVALITFAVTTTAAVIILKKKK